VEKCRGVSQIVRTFSPNGMQALMFTPQGRDIAIGYEPMRNGEYIERNKSVALSVKLNLNIGKRCINAICILPNLFEYNINLAKDLTDLLKLNDCRQPQCLSSNSTPIPFVWYIVIVIIVIVLAWLAYRRWNNNHDDHYDDR
jgi:hypothetical protein